MLKNYDTGVGEFEVAPVFTAAGGIVRLLVAPRPGATYKVQEDRTP